MILVRNVRLIILGYKSKKDAFIIFVRRVSILMKIKENVCNA